MREENIFERNPKKTILFVVIALTLMLDVSLTHFFLWQKNTDYSDPLLGIRHEVYHHTWVKNGFVETEYPMYHDKKIKLYSNSLGFRDRYSREISLSPEDDIEKRIVFIGDSFVEGSMMNYEDTFVGLIESGFNESIEVLNAGVGANSPIIYWRKLKYLIEEIGLKFDEVVVELDISDVGDEIHLYQLSETGSVVKRDTKRWSEYGDSFAARVKKIIRSNTTFLYHTLNTVYDAVAFGKQSNYFWDKKRKEMGPWYNLLNSPGGKGMWTVNEEIYSEWGEEGIREMKKYMNSLIELLQDNNIQLTVAVHPWPIQVWHEDIDSLQVQIWQSWCRANKVKFINYFPEFVRKGLSNEEKRKVLEKYYIRGDFHFNKLGNQLIARKFLKSYFEEFHSLKN